MLLIQQMIFVQSYEKSRDWSNGWTRYYSANFGKQVDTSKLRELYTFTPTLQEVSYRSFIELPEIASAGYYLVKLGQGEDVSYSWLQVSPLAQHFYCYK